MNQILNENIEEKNGKVQKKKEHVENKLVSLVDEKIENSSKPQKIKGDTHYGCAENRFQMLQRGITVIAPIQEGFNPASIPGKNRRG